MFRRNSLVVVAVFFVAVFGVLQGFIRIAEAAGFLDPLMPATAAAAAALVRLAGIPVSLVGRELFLSTRTLLIDLDCTALTIAALYTALVVAYPLSVRTRLLALAIGLPTILLANLIRLLGVAVASEHLSPWMFAFAHDYLFKVAMMLVVVGLWATWLQIARGHATNA
jgi:exosortase/archaeosortase family protein